MYIDTYTLSEHETLSKLAGMANNAAHQLSIPKTNSDIHRSFLQLVRAATKTSQFALTPQNHRFCYASLILQSPVITKLPYNAKIQFAPHERPD